MNLSADETDMWYDASENGVAYRHARRMDAVALANETGANVSITSDTGSVIDVLSPGQSSDTWAWDVLSDSSCQDIRVLSQDAASTAEVMRLQAHESWHGDDDLSRVFRQRRLQRAHELCLSTGRQVHIVDAYNTIVETVRPEDRKHSEHGAAKPQRGG